VLFWGGYEGLVEERGKLSGVRMYFLGDTMRSSRVHAIDGCGCVLRCAGSERNTLASSQTACLAVVTVLNRNLTSATPFREAFSDFRRMLKDAVVDMQV
jgi:hypothetical protein